MRAALPSPRLPCARPAFPAHARTPHAPPLPPQAHEPRQADLLTHATLAHPLPPLPLQVNFHMDLIELIRETRYLDRMGFPIPEIALNVALQVCRCACCAPVRVCPP